MSLPDGFEKEGFLCRGIADGIANRCAENNDWFKLVNDANVALMNAAFASMKSVKASSMAPEAVAVRILLRSCGILQGIILLTERGMVAEGRTLVRSLIEGAFCIAALNDEPAAFIEMLKKDFDASRANQAKFILARNVAKDGKDKKRFQAIVEEIDRAEIMSPKKVAALGPLTKHYLYYQRLSDDSAHTSARSLHRHILKDAAGDRWDYKLCVGNRDDNAATLHQAVIAALAIGIGICQMLKLTADHGEFGKLAVRLEAMPEVQII